MKKISKKKATLGLGIFILFILFFAVFGERGLLKIFKLQKEIYRFKQSVKSLNIDNQELATNINKMKHESAFQERSARETLGMAKENEIIYEFSEELKSPSDKMKSNQNK